MNTHKSIAIRLAAIFILADSLLPSLISAQIGKTTGSLREMISYRVYIMDLKKLVMQKDIDGIEQKYEQAYVVALRGDFPRDQATGMELFIGEYKVPEYGGTRDGIYFRIFDPKLIKNLEGKEFRYRVAGEKTIGLNTKFSIEKLKPLETIKEGQPLPLPGENIRLDSYGIVIKELKKPIMRRDIKGKKQRYDREHIVELKGDFPRDRALALELFIGDYRVPEYGGTKDGIYFKVYDERLFEKLEGKEFRYRFGDDQIVGLKLKFSAIEKQPFKIIK